MKKQQQSGGSRGVSDGGSGGHGLVVISAMATFDANRNKTLSKMYGESGLILTVGDGDLTFSRALCSELVLPTFGPPRLICTTYDSEFEMTEKYSTALKTRAMLTSRNCAVLHQVDATYLARSIREQLYSHPPAPPAMSVLESFSRIIFNFPHLGGATQEDIKANQNLLSQFFLSARPLLIPPSSRPRPQSAPRSPIALLPGMSLGSKQAEDDEYMGGQIHVALRNTPFYESWDIEKLAKEQGLRLLRKEPFLHSRYPGYQEQRTNPGVLRNLPPSTHGAINYIFVVSPNAPPLTKQQWVECVGLVEDISSYKGEQKIDHQSSNKLNKTQIPTANKTLKSIKGTQPNSTSLSTPMKAKQKTLTNSGSISSLPSSAFPKASPQSSPSPTLASSSSSSSSSSPTVSIVPQFIKKKSTSLSSLSSSSSSLISTGPKKIVKLPPSLAKAAPSSSTHDTKGATPTPTPTTPTNTSTALGKRKHADGQVDEPSSKKQKLTNTQTEIESKSSSASLPSSSHPKQAVPSPVTSKTNQSSALIGNKRPREKGTIEKSLSSSSAINEEETSSASSGFMPQKFKGRGVVEALPPPRKIPRLTKDTP